jgi:cytochrome c oxidase accessory protein FixG
MFAKVFSLGKKRAWVYPLSVKGRFQTLRKWTFVALHVILFILPWITVNGHPAVRVDFAARQTFLMGSVLTASETVLLLIILLFATFSLFFFTSLYGRIWCGYACPQTVFLESWIRPLEQFIEGGRVVRQRRDNAGFTFDLVWRKTAKWSAFAVVAIVLSISMMSYFAGAKELWLGLGGRVEYTLVAILAGAWFLDFVWFREQFCNYLCPYARFQGALTDDDSLLIMYDEARGEPRGGKTAKNDGRCIDCDKCVAVCPQGIDIRHGFQLECIACARCIDACAGVMGKLGHETLVDYSSVVQSKGGKIRWTRPRTVVYAALLAVLMVAAATKFIVRIPFEATVNRAPGTLYSVDADGFVRNTYLVNIINNDGLPEGHSFHVTIVGMDDAEVTVQDVQLGPNEGTVTPLIIRLPVDGQSSRTLSLNVLITSDIGELILETTFKTGANVGE